MSDQAPLLRTEHMADPAPLSAFPQGAQTSLVRAWFYLVWLSILRQARMRQMVWIALGLLVFSATFIGIMTVSVGWNAQRFGYSFPSRYRKDRLKEAGVRTNDLEKALIAVPRSPQTPQWELGLLACADADVIDSLERFPAGPGERVRYNVRDGMNYSQWALLAAPRSPLTPQWEHGVIAAGQAALDESSFGVFVRFFMLAGPSLLVNFLLPIWSLSFATDSIGNDRESRNLIWLLTRPLPRPLIYLAKFVAVLPWTLGLNVGGFGLLCLAGGQPGRTAFIAFWPAVVSATFAFTALYMVIGAYFRRPAVIAIVYSFFLEVILGNMPGFLKRASVSFYTRCMMYEAVADKQIGPQQPQIFLAVDGATAFIVLLSATLVLLVVGMIVFARTEYHEVS
jgi:ABC-2 type transport system permease protein